MAAMPVHQLTLIATAKALLGLSLSLWCAGYALLWTKVERLLCTGLARALLCPLALSGECTRGHMLGCDWLPPYLENPCMASRSGD